MWKQCWIGLGGSQHGKMKALVDIRLSIVQKYLQCGKVPPNKEAQLSEDYNSSLPMGKILFPGRLYPRYNLLSFW